MENESLGAYLERIRVALGGYRDSNLASLAETLKARRDALEAENERLLAWAVAAYNARQPITDAALRMVLNVEADSDMLAGQRQRGNKEMAMNEKEEQIVREEAQKLRAEICAERARTEAAEAVLSQTQAERDEYRAECKRLREQVANLQILKDVAEAASVNYRRSWAKALVTIATLIDNPTKENQS
jgi:chromosome segregation ATPase